MRVALIAVAGACAMLAACGGPKASQEEKSSDAKPAPSVMAMVAAPVSGANAAKIMHERHEGMETIGKANKAIRRELEAGSPNVGTIRTSAGQIADLAKKSSGWFPAGTGPEVGKTGAKPEIWQDPKDFAAKLAVFQKSAAAFNAAASGGDVNAIKARFGDLGQTCKACHDKYRSDMHH
jgi:cytochrome c556